MAYNPTAANILSSLGIKGAALEGTIQAAGCVPVLDENGKLPASFIPEGEIQQALTVLPLNKVAFVDPATTSTVKNGSIANPFASIGAAASAGFPAIVLARGTYSDEQITFSGIGNSSETVYLIDLGGASFTSRAMLVNGLPGTSTVVLVDVRYHGTLRFGCNVNVVCRGLTDVLTMTASEGFSISTLSLDATSNVSSPNATTITSLDKASQVGYDPGGDKNVSTALDNLKGRKVRVLNFAAGSSGLEDAGSSDVAAADGRFDLSEHDRQLMEAANEAFLHRGEAVDFDHIVAQTVEANTIDGDEVNAGILTIDGLKIRIDEYNYLVVDDGEESSSSSYSEPGMYLEDVTTGIVYEIGIRGGRMFARNTEQDSSSYVAPTEIRMKDEETGEIYALTVNDGVLVVSPVANVV